MKKIAQIIADNLSQRKLDHKEFGKKIFCTETAKKSENVIRNRTKLRLVCDPETGIFVEVR